MILQSKENFLSVHIYFSAQLWEKKKKKKKKNCTVNFVLIIVLYEILFPVWRELDLNLQTRYIHICRPIYILLNSWECNVLFDLSLNKFQWKKNWHHQKLVWNTLQEAHSVEWLINRIFFTEALAHPLQSLQAFLLFNFVRYKTVLGLLLRCLWKSSI